MALRVLVHPDPAAFAAAARGFLEEREVENSLLLGLIEGGPATALTVEEEGGVAFAAFYRELNLIVTRGPDEAIHAAAAELAARGTVLPAVVGPAREAELFAGAWGPGATLVVRQRIFELRKVLRPPAVPGRMRPMSAGDLEQAAAWARAFELEALVEEERRGSEEARRRAERRIAEGTWFAWEAEGRLVSMAGLARPTRRTVSVNAVYTPPGERRRGYATALVAAVSAEGLLRGKSSCVLYTDLANPVSNSIYPKIGYRPVCDSSQYRFRAARGGGRLEA